jgi:hypothetical protein
MVMASSGCLSVEDYNGPTIFVADAHRADGKRFVVRADEKLTAFVNSQTKCRSGCLNASLRLGFTIRKNGSILSFSNPTKKVSSK